MSRAVWVPEEWNKTTLTWEPLAAWSGHSRREAYRLKEQLVLEGHDMRIRVVRYAPTQAKVSTLDPATLRWAARDLMERSRRARDVSRSWEVKMREERTEAHVVAFWRNHQESWALRKAYNRLMARAARIVGTGQRRMYERQL